MDWRGFAPGSESYEGCAASHGPIALRTDVLKHIVERAITSRGDIPRIDKSFWHELVPAIQSQLGEIRSDAEYCKFSHDLTIDMLAAARVNPGIPPTRGPTRGPTFSSIGIIEKFMAREYTSDRLSIEFMRMIGTVRVALPVIACHFWLLREEFNLQLTACDQFYTSQFVQDCARETERWISAMTAEFEPNAPSVSSARL